MVIWSARLQFLLMPSTMFCRIFGLMQKIQCMFCQVKMRHRSLDLRDKPFLNMALISYIQ